MSAIDRRFLARIREEERKAAAGIPRLDEKKSALANQIEAVTCCRLDLKRATEHPSTTQQIVSHFAMLAVTCARAKRFAFGVAGSTASFLDYWITDRLQRA